MQTTDPKTESKTDEEALAGKIWRHQLSRKDGATSSIPSERQLAEMFEVTRHTIRKSIQILESEGKLVRLSRRAIVPASTIKRQANEDGLSISCVNFIRSPAFLESSISWLVEEYLAGYTAALEDHNIKTRHVICTDEERDFESFFWQRVPFRQQGCVLISRHMPHLLNWLDEHNVPHVVQYPYAYDPEGRPPHHRVFINKVGGAFDAVRYLAGLGHRQIGFIGNIAEVPRNKAVFEGYDMAMKTLAYELPDRHIWPIYTDRLEVAIKAISERFDPHDLPTAFLARNDIVAIALIQVARNHGIDVPGQLSVHGFNDQFEATQCQPPLTTMRTPRRRLAQEAVRLLLEAAANPDLPPQTRVLNCEPVHRQSVAPPSR